MTNDNTPALRFDGFGGEWQHTKLNQVGLRVTTRNSEELVSETFTNSALRGVVSQLDYFDHSVSNPSNISKYLVVENDDFVYNPRISTTAPYGPVGRNRLGRPGAMSPLYLVFRVFGADRSFLEQFFKSDHWYDFMRLNGNVGARHDRFSISDSQFMGMDLHLPSSLEEQRTVGELFDHADSLIQLHRNKHRSLRQTRSALLQRLFPQGGADEPDVRLTAHTGRWAKRHMRDIATYGKGNGYSKASITDVGTPVIHYGRLYTRYQTVMTSIDTFAQLQPGATLSRGNEVLVPASGESAEDIAVASALLQPGVIIGGDLNIVRPQPGIDPVFLALSLSHGIPRAELVRRAQGKSVVHLRTSDIEQLEILIPPMLEEQRAIGAIFTDLDELITTEANYVSQLTQAKTALLQRMFV